MAPSPSKAKTSNAANYVYERIADLRICPSANFYGRVVQFKPPRPTRGSDFIMNIVVNDESIQSVEDPDAGIGVNIFMPEVERFPRIEAIGDVVQFRHFRIQHYQGAVQALSTKWAAYTVFYRDPVSGNWKSRPEGPISENELKELERFESERAALPLETELKRPKVQRRRELQTINQIVESHHFFDLIAEVVQVPFSRVSDNRFTLQLTDYTANPLLPYWCGSEELLSEKKMVLTVTLWDNYAVAGERLNLVPGDLVHIQNLVSKLNDDRLEAVLHGETNGKTDKLNKIASNSPLAQELIKRKERLVEEQLANAQAELLNAQSSSAHTVALWKGAITSIASVLSHPEKNAKFKVKGKVVSHKPNDIVDFCRPFCPKCVKNWPDRKQRTCPSCGDEIAEDSFVFLFSLKIADSTGELSLIFCFNDATTFLDGFSAVNLEKNPRQLRQLEDIIGRLMEGGKGTASIFCISSYEVGGKRKYRVSDTIFKK